MSRKTYVIIVASMAAVMAFVQFSGLGQLIRDNTPQAFCEGGTCAMKLYDKMMEEK
ncbi:hypothetical protein [Zhenpiania hominis]|uniref:Uncharacterized protein n=1 Tax=Zhenpiania hominis TaxID=2763644 RepID=A0A923NJU2_9FIRM|nr:hypothetical protein [Zhenpiania hominis]MBC6678587.1 hypothetical protein [Zhenpiania hominis]